MTFTPKDRKHILCPVDFSEFSPPSLAYAVRLARVFGARLVVLHVIPPFPAAIHEGSGFPWIANPEELLRVQRQGAQEQLDRLVEPVAGSGVPIETRVVAGDTVRSINAAAEALPADLVVVGTHGQGGFERLVMGSIAEKVIRTAPCAVLSVGKESMGSAPTSGFRRILCAIDLTEASGHTLGAGLALAEECRATVTLLHVLEGVPAPGSPHFPVALPDFSTLYSDARDHALTLLRRSVPDEVRSAVVERVEAGTPWREIVRVADETRADLVIVGAHARRGRGPALLGSTSSQVVRHIGCPVLVVREGLHPSPDARDRDRMAELLRTPR
jgi:nucleotide-binding universal stress UspA family protein